VKRSFSYKPFSLAHKDLILIHRLRSFFNYYEHDPTRCQDMKHDKLLIIFQFKLTLHQCLLLNYPFGIMDLSLAPTNAMNGSVAEILEEIGLERVGTHGTIAAPLQSLIN
jgi:hypothetical protein